MLEGAGVIPQVDIGMLLRLLADARNELHGRERERLAALLAGIVGSRAPGAPIDPSPALDGIVDRLQEEGYCALAELLSPEQVAAVVAHFRSRPCFNAHTHAKSDGIARRLGEGAETFHYGCYALADVVDAPHLIELANDPRMLAIAGRYLGCTPTLYSLNAWWSFPGFGRPAIVSQSFHRDLDDFRFCTLFLYLTDVDERGGPHVYVRRTHRVDLLERELEEATRADVLEGIPPAIRQRVSEGALVRGEGYGLDPAINRLFGHRTDMIAASAGSGLIADTYGFHMGLPPERGPRLIFWARYGLHANFGPPSPPVEWRRVARRISWDERAAYINRALIRE